MEIPIQSYRELNSLPLIGYKFGGVHLVDQNTCQFKSVCYVNIVDVADNSKNNIILEESYGKVEKHPCPKSILMSLVSIIR